MAILAADAIKGLLRNGRDGGVGSALGYLFSRRVRSFLPGLMLRVPGEAAEVHVLTGRGRLTMALWMIASWTTATGRGWRFVIHDDGTLREADARAIRTLVPGSRVLLSAESTPEVSRHLTSYPLCLQCRNLHPLCRKIFDIAFFASNDRFLAIDTDILFFRSPDRLERWFSEGQPGCIFLEDVRDVALLKGSDVQKLLGVQLIERVNTGIIAVPKAALCFDRLESLLLSTDLLRRDRWYIEQTLFALAASIFGRVELLPPQHYVLTLEAPCPKDAIARHYPGAVRHLFYSEGLPKVIPLLRRAGR
jgi:hypothetical protein